MNILRVKPVIRGATFLAIPALMIAAAGAEAATVRVAEIASGMTSPVGVVSANDGSGRLFILDQVGIIWVTQEQGGQTPEVFLDIRDRVTPLDSGYDEKGLLGLAFHPDYVSNGRFFVKYSAPLRPEAPPGWSHTNNLSEFQVSDTDPDQGDPNSERLILAIDHPQGNHNGGRIAFGPDGYLYLADGDGGGANDVGEGHTPLIGNGQDITKLLGKVLRIDVFGGEPYGIPPDNPFVDQEGADEIFAYGFRNPYSFSFDRGGDHGLILGDVGQNLWEEVDVVEIGQNYGWNLKEATHCFNPQNGEAPGEKCTIGGYRGERLVNPVLEYPNAGEPLNGIGLAVIGGFIYRGTLLGDVAGQYIFGDLSQGTGSPDGLLFMANPERNVEGFWDFQELEVLREGSQRPNELGHYVKGFGEDERGEVYVATSDSLGPSGSSGRVYRLEETFFADSRSPQTRRIKVELMGGTGTSPRLELNLDEPTHVSVGIYDVAGRSVRLLAEGLLPAGRQELTWDGRDGAGSPAASGLYFYRVLSPGGHDTKRFLLLR